MAEIYVTALLDFRLLILLAVVVGGVAAIHIDGPFELQAPVDRVIVQPVVQSTAALASLLHIGRRHAGPEK